jgi:predicted site-specific integrase-resolvase
MTKDQTGGETTDLVPVSQIARVLNIPRSRVAGWIRAGKLAAVPTRRGKVVSLSAARSLASTAELAAPVADGDYVRVAEASQLTGVSRVSLYRWVRSARLSSRHTLYGAYVSLTEVRALASQATEHDPSDRD